MALARNISSEQAKRYYDHDDYYTKGEGLVRKNRDGLEQGRAGDSAPSRWYGKGAHALGLEGPVDAARFQALVRGELPDGTVLHRGGSGPRRAGTDFEFSAPKSFSIQALVVGDERLIAVHEQAVATARQRIEAVTATRVAQHGTVAVEVTGKAVIAQFLHTTSRAGDPNLHSHVVALNLTQRSDGQWRSVDNTAMFDEQRLMYEIYQAELARGAKSLGYEVTRGRHGAPELARISRAQIEEFSRRSSQIDAGLSLEGLSRETATAGQKKRVALATRDRKQSFDREALQADWQLRAKALGIDLVRLARRDANDLDSTLARASAVLTAADWRAAKQHVTFSLEHLSEREAAFPRAEVIRVALKAGMGEVGYGAVLAELSHREQHGEVLTGPDGKAMTTPAAVALERRILALEAAGRRIVPPIATPRDLGHSLEARTLTAGQEEAVTLAMTTRNRVIGIQGLAGSGKTTALAAFKVVAEASGYQLIGLAPSHSAVKALTAAGLRAQTLSSWLADPDASPRLTARTVLVIDEAGLVGNAQIAASLERGVSSGARVILVGDVKQYEAVEAGRAFAVLINAGMETAKMTEMLRQREASLARAARLSVEHPAEALTHLEVREIPDRGERHAAIAKDYAALPALQRAGTLVLTGTNDARSSLNAAIRERLIADGALGIERTVVESFQRQDLTRAEQKQLDRYHVGDAIRFERTYRRLRIESGAILRVAAVSDHVVLEDTSGRKVQFYPAQLSVRGFTLGTIETRELARGDSLRITGTDRSQGYRNGERGTVEQATPVALVVRLTDGRSVSLNRSSPLPIEYAYAVTGHSAQGLGAERVFLDKDTASRTTDHRSFYTDLTRATSQAIVFTNDRTALPRAITRKAEKSSALELERLTYKVNTRYSLQH